MIHRTLILVLLLTLGYLSNASAQDSIKPEYIQLVKQAVTEFQAGRWDEARSLFLLAHKINPNARTLRGIGMVSFEASDYVNTIQYLQQALEDNRKPLTTKQREEAENILSKANSFVGRLRVDLTPALSRLSVDGIAKEIREEALLVNPGKHTLIAKFEGYQTRQITIDVSSGATVDLELTLDPIADTEDNIKSPTQPIPDAVPEEPDEKQESDPFLAPYIVMAAGGALLIGSGVTGMLSYLAERELHDECSPDYVCDEKHEATIERGEILQTVSFVLLGTGVATAVIGGVLWLTTDSERESAPASSVMLRCGMDGCLGSVRSTF